MIVHLYEEMGPRCVEALHGMFGLAVWDQGERRLLLARDRVGKKPLYYADRPEALSFASELTALMQDPEIPRDPDPAALDAYLAYRWVPAPGVGVRRRAQAARRAPTWSSTRPACAPSATGGWTSRPSGGSPAPPSATRRSAARSGAPWAGG